MENEEAAAERFREKKLGIVLSYSVTGHIRGQACMSKCLMFGGARWHVSAHEWQSESLCSSRNKFAKHFFCCVVSIKRFRDGFTPLREGINQRLFHRWGGLHRGGKSLLVTFCFGSFPTSHVSSAFSLCAEVTKTKAVGNAVRRLMLRNNPKDSLTKLRLCSSVTFCGVWSHLLPTRKLHHRPCAVLT